MAGELRAEVEIADGLLSAVRFIREGSVTPSPPLALAPSLLLPLSPSLLGAPADLQAVGFAARARAGVPFGADPGGATSAEVGAAVRDAVRAQGLSENPDRVGTFTGADLDRLTADWPALGWRVVGERPLSPAVNLAVDEVLLDRVAKGLRPPTLRFWGWAGPAVVLGRSQVLANEVDADAAADAGVAVVRRMSGGGAMFAAPGGVITYSLYLPEAAVGGLTIRQSYEVCDGWAVRALRGLGLDAHYIPVNDIGWRGGKIAGAAQARRAGAVLHHTTMAYELDLGLVARVLRLGQPRPAGRGVASAAKVVSPLVEQSELSREAVVVALAGVFAGRYGGVADELAADELAAAGELAGTKYTADGWTRGTA